MLGVARAYKAKFRQDAVGVTTVPADAAPPAPKPPAFAFHPFLSEPLVSFDYAYARPYTPPSPPWPVEGEVGREAPTAQDIFDTVARHLMRQGRRAVMTGKTRDICAYRAPDGARCAVGALIPDRLYDPAMERRDVDMVLGAFPSLAFLRPHRVLLRDLQNVHDSAGSWHSPLMLADSLRAVAYGHNLSPAAVEIVLTR